MSDFMWLENMYYTYPTSGVLLVLEKWDKENETLTSAESFDTGCEMCLPTKKATLFRGKKILSPAQLHRLSTPCFPRTQGPIIVAV